ncbi:MAG: ATP-binding protein [Myxococcales bacterium]|nr:ATP-binding protein [Myxococcales bacterium]
MPILARALLARYLRRYWFRAVQAGGELGDLFVGLDEVRAEVGDAPPPPPGLPDEATIAREVAAARAARPADVGRLRQVAGLDADALEWLVVAATLQGHPGLLRTSTFAWADFARKQPTVAFLIELCADDAAHAARLERALAPDAPLRRLALISLGEDRAWQPETPLLHRPVAVPDSVVRLLRGEPPIGEALPTGAVTRETRGPRPEGLILDARERLEAVLTRCMRGLDRAPVALIGPTGTGRRTLARAFALRHDLGLHVLPLETLDQPAFEGQLLAALRDALLDGAALLLRVPELPPNDRRLPALGRLLARVPVPVVIAADAPALPPLLGALRALRVVELGALSRPGRVALLRHLLAENAFVIEAQQLARLVDAYRLTPGDLDRALGDARVEAGDAAAFDERVFDQAVRRQVRTRLGDLAQRVTTEQTWADLIIGDEQRSQIKEIQSHARHRAQVFEGFGLGARVGGRGRGLACLFSGPPGTGKTMTAALIAQDLGLDLFQVDLSRVVDKYVGETEKNLARLFAEASRLPVVLLFDEADSLFAARTKVESSNDRYANLEVNYLLQLMERHEGISILTTNQGTGIDQAFMRRLRFRVHFPLPTAPERLLLWRAMIAPGCALDDDVDLEWLARRWEMSGALIRNAFVRAAFLAADAATPISQEMLVRATRAELAEVGRLGSR